MVLLTAVMTADLMAPQTVEMRVDLRAVMTADSKVLQSVEMTAG